VCGSPPFQTELRPAVLAASYTEHNQVVTRRVCSGRAQLVQGDPAGVCARSHRVEVSVAVIPRFRCSPSTAGEPSDGYRDKDPATPARAVPDRSAGWGRSGPGGA
jgi:hypothetical protein